MNKERRRVLFGIAAALTVIAGAALFAPAEREDDPRPSTYNAGPQGAKAAYLLLGKLGYRVSQQEGSLTGLQGVKAERTTLVLADPWGASTSEDQHAVEDFLKRGGRVIATGEYGAQTLPGYYWNDNDLRPHPVCRTVPQGASALAEAGTVSMVPVVLAKDNIPETEPAQTCDGGAAVIYYRHGAGTAVWWASPSPITNRGLHEDANLKLLLASIGERDRQVVFDESNGARIAPSPWSRTRGLPLTALGLQLALVAVLLVFSFGRRHGPMRALETTPRTSPLEFAESMGNLYHRAGAGEAAVLERRQRFLLQLERQCGLSHEVAHGPAAGIAAQLRDRFGFADHDLGALLSETSDVQRMDASRALRMVQSFHNISAALSRAAGHAQHNRPNGERPLV